MSAAHDQEWERALPALMVRYQAADEAAVTKLVQLLSPRLLRFFMAYGLPRHEADDALQECWLRIHRSRHTYRAAEPVLPWVFAIARHTRIDGHRKSRRRGEREVLVADPPETNAAGVPRTSPRGAQLMRFLKALPPRQREVIVMLKVSGMSLEDVAKATSSTVGAVKQRAHRAYEAIRSSFAREDRT